MTWGNLHHASEKAAVEAEDVFRAGKAADAALLYAKAAQLEEDSLSALDDSKVRTKGITAVSAVSLWFKAGDFAHAEQLAYSMLADLALPQFARTDLKDLIQALWLENSKREAQIGFLPGQVFVSVKGGEVISGGAPLDLVLEKVQTIQAMFYRTIEFIRDLPFRTRGGPTIDIQEACRPWLFQSPPGSYQFSVAIQEPKQRDFFKEDTRPDLVASQFLDILRAASNEDQKALDVIIPKREYRNAFLKLSRNLAPTGKRFESIEFRSATHEAQVALTSEGRRNINSAIKQSRPADEPNVAKGEEREINGILRVVNLDKDFLDINADGQPIHVIGLADTMDDVIGPMVNKRVKALVAVESTNVFRLRDIELDG
jgi:hypothetical protein